MTRSKLVEYNKLHEIEKFGRKSLVIKEVEYRTPLYCGYCHRFIPVVLETRQHKFMCNECYQHQFDAIFEKTKVNPS